MPHVTREIIDEFASDFAAALNQPAGAPTQMEPAKRRSS
jgi:hypothetical protein